jgi:hypothetical protein
VEQILFIHMGCEVRKIPAAGVIFSLTSPFIELDSPDSHDKSGTCTNICALIRSAPMSAKVIICCLLLILLLMFFNFRVVESPRVVSAGEEQALIITIPLHSGKTGNADELKRLYALEDQLIVAIKESGAGEYDGNEIGEGVFTFYIYGPSAERLFSVIRPVLKKFRPPAGSYLIKRYGKPGSKQDKVAIDAD